MSNTFWNEASGYMSSKRKPASHQWRTLYRNELAGGYRRENHLRALPSLPLLSEITSPATEQVVSQQTMQPLAVQQPTSLTAAVVRCAEGSTALLLPAHTNTHTHTSFCGNHSLLKAETQRLYLKEKVPMVLVATSTKMSLQIHLLQNR